MRKRVGALAADPADDSVSGVETEVAIQGDDRRVRIPLAQPRQRACRKSHAARIAARADLAEGEAAHGARDRPVGSGLAVMGIPSDAPKVVPLRYAERTFDRDQWFRSMPEKFGNLDQGRPPGHMI